MKIPILGFTMFWANILPAGAVPTVKAMNSLSRKLLANYSRNTLPSSDFNNQFVIYIDAYPLAVGDLDEVEEKLSTVLGFDMTWNDTSIRWDPADHDNITNITLGLNKVWRPTLMLLNPHQNDLKGHSDLASDGISYSYFGTTRWSTMLTLHTTCDVETTYFPFDVQKCEINFYASGNDAYTININATWAKHYPYSKENGAWKIREQKIKGSTFSKMSIVFEFERKPTFMLINNLLPMVILAMLTPLVFLMPNNSGERLGYSVTMMLAVSVYMTIVSDYLPKNSEPMPLISILIFISFILNALIVFIVIMNIKIGHIKDRRSIPGCASCFVRLTRTLFRTKTLTYSGSEEETDDCPKGDNDEEEALTYSGSEEKTEACLRSDNGEERGNVSSPKTARITWIEVSVAVDRWCFVLIYLIKLILITAIFGVISKK